MTVIELLDKNFIKAIILTMCYIFKKVERNLNVLGNAQKICKCSNQTPEDEEYNVSDIKYIGWN